MRCRPPVCGLCGRGAWDFPAPWGRHATAAVDVVCRRRAADRGRRIIAAGRCLMTPTSAALFAMTLSFAVMAAAAAWYVVPWLKVTEPAKGLKALLWLHALRYVAAHLFS